ncbi:MAG: DUF348 domain-containing protein [Ruminococcaceae bacterium]|nr:DUF348 domain-containing protein [Oscillospiraceae bacterium]
MQQYRRKRTAAAQLRSRLPGIWLLMGAAMLSISFLMPKLAPVPEDLKPLSFQLMTGADGTESGLQYVDAGGVLDLTIDVDGKRIELRTDGGTVSEALAKAGVTLGSRDILSCEAGDEVYAGMQLRITRVTGKQETKDVLIKYEIQEVPNDRMMVGETIVLTEGINGSLRETWEVEYHDGVEVNRTLTSSVVTKEPTTAVVETGTYVLPTVNEESKTLSFDDGTVLNYSKKLNVGATAYTCEGKSFNITKTGTTARFGAIAVDPRVIPLNSKLYVQAPDGTWFYGVCTAEDTGGKIKGNRIDLYFDTLKECYSFGYRKAVVYIIEEE